mgnify:CR=1 FL=1
MQVLGISGSPRKDANTDTLVRQVLEGCASAGAGTRLVRLNDLRIGGCQGCHHCQQHRRCRLDDDMIRLYEEVFTADAVVLGSPIYMWQMSGQTKIFCDRLLPVMNPDFSTRFPSPKKMILVFTQGNTDTGAFRPYIDQTAQSLGFLGFDVREILIAGGTAEPGDVRTQTAVMDRALAAGAALVR